MKYLAAAAFLGAVNAGLIDANDFKFMQFIAMHNKQYDTVEEFSSRKAHFLKTDEFILQWNAQEDKTHTAGHNFMSDFSREEYEQRLGLKDQPLPERKSEPVELPEVTNAVSFDWR